MGCDFPLKAYRSASERTSTGKVAITFKPQAALQSEVPFEVPCGNCMGCKLERARQWSVRMMHEAKFHAENSFLTLTYSDETVPQDYGLDLRHWQLFMKRLRKSLKKRIRFFACGEYGDLNGRPHYHAIIFGYDAADKVFHSQSERGDKQYTSRHLSSVWPNGLITTGAVTAESCSYVARYVTKKLNNWGDSEAYRDRYYRLSPVDGAMHQVRPEFAVMSRRPGIGQAYVEKFKGDFYPSGFIVDSNGVKQAPPRYYVSKLTQEEQLYLKRHAKREPRSEKTMERRQARAAVRDARITKLQRKL